MTRPTLSRRWTEGFTSFSAALSSLAPGRPHGQRYVRAVDLTGKDRWVWIGIDLVALAVLCGLASTAFAMTYGPGWIWVTCLGGAVVGLGVGLVAALRRLPTWLTAVGWALAYLVVGTALAMPHQATAMVVPNARTLRQLVLGVVTAWKQLLTIGAPVGETGGLLVVPLITMMLAGTIGVSIALRSSRPGWAWLAPAAAAVVAAAFGVQTAWWPVVLGVGFVVVTLVWTGYRRDYLKQTLLGRKRRRYSLKPVLSAAVVLVIACGCTVLAQPLIVPQTYRHVLRDQVTPPLQIEQWPSPLQAYRANLKDHKDDVLMTVSGLPKGAMIRLATLDAYDGITMNVSNSTTGGSDGGTFTRIGTEVPDDTKGTPAKVTVSIGDYAGDWVPTVGQLRSIDITSTRRLQLDDHLFYNRRTGTAVDTAGVRAGDTYTLDVVVPPQPAQADIKTADAGDLDLPPAEPVPDQLSDAAQRWTTGADGSGDIAIKLEAELRRGYFSDGLANDYPSLPGHSFARLQKMFTEPQMVGDDEQYAVAMALMARQLGLPSRVVYGYRPTSAGTVEIKGGDVAAWVEINLQGYGWVAFFPTPDKSRAPQSDTRKQQSKPRPQVDNPPPPPQKPENPPPDNTPPQAPQQDQNKDKHQIPWRLIGTISAGVGIPALLIGGPLLTIALLKRRRRNRRRMTPEWTSRLSGGWDELLDRARDLGAPLSRQATRTETAAGLVSHYPPARDLESDPLDLARRADAAVFAPDAVSEQQAEAYWHDMDALTAALRRACGAWRRLRSRFSLTSLRRWE